MSGTTNPLNANPTGTAEATATMNAQVNTPGLPPGTELQPVLVNNDDPSMYMDPNSASLAPGNPAQEVPVATGTAATVAPTPVATASTYNAATVSGQTPQMTAAQGTVDGNSLATAAQADVDKRATVQGQLTSLYENPDQTWAAGAIREANQAMAARGLGASSIAGQAITQASLEAATDIAKVDAQTYATYGLANLNNRQQVALQNAQAYATMNLANLSNEQQAALTNQQARITTLLSDQAATNAAAQFNAQSETQVSEFMSQLQQQAAQFAAAQADAMTKANMDATNTWAEFRATMENNRQQFAATNAKEIEMANFAWRRSTNTANTAAINAANQFNATNRLNLSNTALEHIWQEGRDEAQWAFTRSENETSRAANMAMAVFQNSAYKELLSDAQKNEFAITLGKAFTGFLANLTL